MKAIWTGLISVGLVNIPVKLYPASQSRGLNLTFVRKKDNCPVGYNYVCKNTGEKVNYDDLVRAYQLDSGEYIPLNNSDFKKANLAKSNSIRIQNFVNPNQIQSKYYAKPYYLTPQANYEKVYTLFQKALTVSQKVGIVKYILRTKENLGVLTVNNNLLILQQLRYQNQLRDLNKLPKFTHPSVSTNELELAAQLINQMTGKFQPEKYQDSYLADLKKIIAQKIAGKQKIEAIGQPPQPTPSENLLEQLKNSLEKSRQTSLSL